MSATRSRFGDFEHAKKMMRRDIVARRQFHLPFSAGATMSTAETAKLLNCSHETIRRMLNSDELIGYQLRPGLAGSPYRIYKESIAKLLVKIQDEYNLHGLDGPAPATPTTSTPPATTRKP